MIRGIEDSRGTMRSVFPVAVWWVSRPEGTPPRSSVGIWRPLFLVVALGLLVVFVRLLTMVPHPSSTLTLGVAVATILAGTLYWATHTAGAVASTYEAFTALLAGGFCPACAYRIDNVRPEPDGCSVCPECGAAWRR